MSKKCVVVRYIIIGIFVIFVSQILHKIYADIDIAGMPIITKSIKIIAGLYFMPVICIATSLVLLTAMDWLCNNFIKKKPHRK